MSLVWRTILFCTPLALVVCGLYFLIPALLTGEVVVPRTRGPLAIVKLSERPFAYWICVAFYGTAVICFALLSVGVAIEFISAPRRRRGSDGVQQ